MVTTCPFISMLSKLLWDRRYLIFFLPLLSGPDNIRLPWLHAETIWHGFVPSLLLERMVFPSTDDLSLFTSSAICAEAAADFPDISP